MPAEWLLPVAPRNGMLVSLETWAHTRTRINMPPSPPSSPSLSAAVPTRAMSSSSAGSGQRRNSTHMAPATTLQEEGESSATRASQGEGAEHSAA